MITASVTLRFGGVPGRFESDDEATAYIAHPFWPEVNRLIDITKLSGMNRARSEQNRAKALEQHLRTIGLTNEEYAKLQANAARPFHTNDDGFVIIPSASIAAAMTCAADSAKGANKIGGKDDLRTMIRTTDFTTTKKPEDAGVWERFAVVTLGSGAKASNQRGFRSNKYLADFTAKGRLRFSESFVKPQTLKAFLAYAGTVGVGSARKMGWGRFAVQDFTVESQE